MLGDAGGNTGLAGAATHSNRSLGILRNGMVGLAAQATGTAGPVSRLAQGLLLFGGGSTLVLGVAAGIGALALAYRAFTQDTRDAEQAQKDLSKALQAVGIHAQLTDARRELARLKGLLTERQTPGQVWEQFLSDLTGGKLGASREEQRQSVLRGIRDQQMEIVRLTGEWKELLKEVADEEYRGWLAETKRVEALKDGLETAVRLKDAMREAFFQQEGKSPKAIRAGIAKFDLNEMLALEKPNVKEWLPPDEEIRRIGMAVGRTLAEAVGDGFADMHAVLRSIFLMVLNFALGNIFGQIFSNVGIGASKTGDPGMLPKSSVVGPANMNLTMSGIQPVTAYFVARDPAFQQLLREGILVAASQGFNK